MLYSTGSNSNGQLAHATLLDTAHFTPVHFNSLHTSASEESNGGGKSPDESSRKMRIHDVKFGGTHTIAIASARGEDRAEVPETSRRLYVCGSNNSGQLSSIFPPAQNLTSFSNLPLELLLSLLLSTGGTTEKESEEYDQIAGIEASWDTTFVWLKKSKDEGRYGSSLLIAFGGNDWGELGEGSRKGITRIRLDDLLQPEDRGRGEVWKISKLRAGPRHIVALLSSGPISTSSILSTERSRNQVLVGWGASRHGQLGLHALPLPRILTPSILSTTFLHDDILDFSVGKDHTSILIRNEEGEEYVEVLGWKKAGLPAKVEVASLRGEKEEHLRANSVQSTWSGTCIMSMASINSATSNGSESTLRLHALGSNSHGQLALPKITTLSSTTPIPISIPPNSVIKALATGSEHLILHTTSSSDQKETEILAWGWNEHGNLGDGTMVDGEVPKVVWKGSERGQVRGVWAGCGTSWIEVVE